MTSTFPPLIPSPGFKSSLRDISRKFSYARWKNKQAILSVSLINGRFKAISILNNTIHSGWEKPEPIVSRQTLAQALQEAVHHTKFSGTDLAMLVEDPRFSTCTLQVPPMDPADLLPVLERKVQQEKSCEGPAAWRYRIGLPSRVKLNIYLEIWPQSFIDEIVQICQEAGLYLRQLAPLSALSESQLSTLPLQSGKATLLITMLEGKIMFIAGRDDGTALWIRHLFPAQDQVSLGERVGTEVNRTMMFVTQQTNFAFSNVWILGEEKEMTAQEIQPYVATPVLPFPIKPDWKYWLWAGTLIPIDHTGNFTPLQVLQAPLKDALANMAAVIIAVFILFGVGTTSLIEGYLMKHHSADETMKVKVGRLQQNHEYLENNLILLQAKRQWAKAVREASSPELEGPFLSYLGTAIPPQIILHKAFLGRTEHGWDVELNGSASADLSTAMLVVEQFVQQLAEGPYHVLVQGDWRDQLLGQTSMISASTADRLLFRFTMKGTMS